MKFRSALLLATVVFTTASIDAQDAPAPAEAPTTSSVPGDAATNEAPARNAALELAGAFSNDGYKIRDGYWFSSATSDTAPIIEVNLFTGNEYWFCAAAVPSESRIAVTVYNELGELVDQQTYADGARFAAGVEPAASGKHFVKVTLVEGAKSDFCLVYCYK